MNRTDCIKFNILFSFFEQNSHHPLSIFTVMSNPIHTQHRGFFLSLLCFSLLACTTRADSSIYQTFDYARYSNDTQIELVIKLVDSIIQPRTVSKQISDTSHSPALNNPVLNPHICTYPIDACFQLNSSVQQILNTNSVLTTGAPRSMAHKVFTFHQSKGEDAFHC
jgi:hypothetical protein